ncbi:MAG TPA: histidine phosphatase family protein [Micropepsaceae bacterium]|nr:histidine phosphatase family protein [Micropepsaceae bacterium]
MTMHHRVRIFSLLLAALMTLSVAPARGASTAAQPLIAALREGGYVLLMRHASSPAARPDKSAADRENTALERQLDKKGRSTSRAMGAAMRALHLPIHEILSSPTYRALETVRIAGLPQPRTAAELGDGGQSMQPLQPSPAAWLRNLVATVPAPGTDTLIVTHAPNIIGAFGANLADVADGEILVFRPDGNGDAMLAGSIKIEQWPALARLK